MSGKDSKNKKSSGLSSGVVKRMERKLRASEKKSNSNPKKTN